LLIEIDSKPYEVKLAADQASAQLAEAKRKSAEATLDLTQVTTKATLDQAEADLKASRAMLEQAHAETGAAEAEAKRAGLDLKRADLLSETAIPVQKRDLAESGSKVASARFLEARKAVLTAEARIQASEGKVEAAQTGPQQIEVARTQVKQAAAGVAQANAAIAASQLQLSYTKICAPVSGRVARKTVRPGETVAAGQALMAVVPDALYVIANFKETQLTHMRVGMPVEIYADTYPDRLLKAHIDSFQSGTGARFSLLPPENATGNYVKVVQRVPVKIVFEALPGPELLLAPGMSVVPKVRVQ
jgi:membrane fusion protein (multidrug efflux system)